MLNTKRILRQASVVGLVVATLLCGSRPAAADDTELLEALGALSASHVYVTFGYVGSVADAFADKRYDADRVLALMQEVDGLMTSVVDQLVKVRGDANANDRAAIDQIVEVFELLQDEARALSNVAEENTPENRQAYDSARVAAWGKLAILLNLPQDGDE